jgi:hypothetical protein
MLPLEEKFDPAMSRSDSQSSRLSALIEELRTALIQESRGEIEGHASSYFLRKEPFVRDGRRYKDERVAYLEALERDIAQLQERLADADGAAMLTAMSQFIDRLNSVGVRTGERNAVAKDFLRWLTSKTHQGAV